MSIVLPPILIVPVVLTLVRQLLTPEEVSLAVIVFASLGHHLPGFVRAYGDRVLFRRYPWRFLLAPPLVFTLALLFTPPAWLATELHLPWKHLHGLELVLFAWGSWYGLRQIFGFVQVADNSNGLNDYWSARLDRGLCLTVFLAGVVFSDARVFAISDALWESGLPIVGPHWLYRARLIVGVVGALVFAAYVAGVTWQDREGRRVSCLKLFSIGATGWFYWYTGQVSVNLLIGITIFDAYQAVQSYAIAGDCNNRGLANSNDRSEFPSLLLPDRWTMLGPCLAGIVTWGLVRSLTLDLNMPSDGTAIEDGYQWLLALFTTSTFLHFYFRSFTLHVSESNRQHCTALSNGTAWLPISVGTLLHASKWAILLAIAASLLLGARWRHNDTESYDLPRLAALAALAPNLPECNALLCRDALDRGDAASAIIFGEQVVAFRKQSHAAHAELGLAYLMGQRPDDARTQFEAAITIAPDRWSYHSDLGAVLTLLGENDRAEVELKTAVQLAPNELAPYEQLAGLYLQQNRTSAAARLYEEIARRFPATLSGELGKITLLTRAGKHHKAVELASFLAAGYAHNWQVLLALGSSLNAAGDPERALAPLEQVMVLRPDLAEAKYQLGLAQFQLGQYPRTIVSLSRALKLDPRHFAAQLQLANTYYVLGEVDAALDAFQCALDLRPADATASANYGGLLAQLGMTDEAEKVYRMALAQHGASPQLNYNMGVLMLQMGEKDEAKKLIRRAAELGVQVPLELREALPPDE